MEKIIRLHPSNKEIVVNPGETVLSALERHGHALPNNCRAGACGECKVKVRSGEYDQGFILDMALSAQDREQNYGLMCMAKVTSDVLEIEWGSEDAKPKLFPPRENAPYIITEKIQITPSIVRFTIRSLGESMRFWPGQYITLGPASGPKRCYSIGNTPNDQGEIILYITKNKKGNTSLWAHEELHEGDQLNVSGPYGTFIGDPNAETPVLCLAAGSGLAPILSLANGALFRGGFKYPATILFSARTKEDLFEQGLFKYLQKKFRNFKFRYTLTQEENPDGLEGRITEILPKLYPDLSSYSVYLAGAQSFVDDCTEIVGNLGAKPENVHTEGFTSTNGAQQLG